MAGNIIYNTTSPFGSRVAIVVRDIKEAQAQLSRSLDMANNITNGGTNLVALEGSKEFGVAAGQGQAFYNALASFNSALFADTTKRTPLQASIDLDIGGG